jgi:hypothetical protein
VNLGCSYVETAIGKPCAKAELIASPLTTGDSVIRYLVYLKPPVSTHERG